MPTPIEEDFSAQRLAMIELISIYVQFSADELDKDQLDERVLAAMAEVPRQDFVPLELRPVAYADGPLPIGYGKTISQPFIVALMTDLLELRETDRVLEIGTGLGYHAAVLAKLARQLYTVEIIEELAEQARRRLTAAGYDNIAFRLGDGAQGWPEHGPFDKIMVAAASELMPPALLQQLKPGGRMVVPTGLEEDQQLLLVEKDSGGRVRTREVLPVRFAPLVASH